MGEEEKVNQSTPTARIVMPASGHYRAYSSEETPAEKKEFERDKAYADRFIAASNKKINDNFSQWANNSSAMASKAVKRISKLNDKQQKVNRAERILKDRIKKKKYEKAKLKVYKARRRTK